MLISMLMDMNSPLCLWLLVGVEPLSVCGICIQRVT